jgi:hypothetical protein
MKKKLIAGCIALAAGIGASQASAASYGVTADTGVYEFLGNMTPIGFQDLFVFNTSPNASGNPSAHSFVSLLAFNSLNSALSSLTAGSYSATLNLYSSCTVGGGGGFISACPGDATASGGTAAITADILTKNGAWTEDGAITWASTLGGTKFGSLTVDSANPGWISVDITSLVEYWAANGTTGDGIVLSAQAYPSVRTPGGAAVVLPFAGDESAFGAFIDIQGTPNVAQTPVPAALPLFATGLGALGLIAHRRKRKQAA